MLWALQSVKPAKALRCASFVYYYVLRYHMFCALMATFLCWSFGKSTVCLRLVCLSLFPPTSPPLFFFFKPCWRVLRIGKVWPCWECLSFPPCGTSNLSLFSWAANTPSARWRRVKRHSYALTHLPSCYGQAAFLATNKAVKRPSENRSIKEP